jgi:flagellar hook protein FlgE
MASINNSLNTAVTGLDTTSEGMNIISNNIANANTKAFKTDRAEFEDQLSVSLGENAQLGRGSRLRTVTVMHNQGAIINTGQLTDLAIQGDGFFAVKTDVSGSREGNGLVYTRQGSFRFDKDGKLTDTMGGRVQGYMADPENPSRVSSDRTDFQVF